MTAGTSDSCLMLNYVHVINFIIIIIIIIILLCNHPHRSINLAWPSVYSQGQWEAVNLHSVDTKQTIVLEHKQYLAKD